MQKFGAQLRKKQIEEEERKMIVFKISDSEANVKRNRIQKHRLRIIEKISDILVAKTRAEFARRDAVMPSDWSEFASMNKDFKE